MDTELEKSPVVFAVLCLQRPQIRSESTYQWWKGFNNYLQADGAVGEELAADVGYMGKSPSVAEVSEDTNMSTVDTFFAPETLQGPYADFYRRAITELLYWRLLRDGNDHLADFAQDPTDPLAFDAIGIQFGQA